jgi:hypothetical protein
MTHCQLAKPVAVLARLLPARAVFAADPAGAEIVANAPPDGQTLHVTAVNTQVSAPMLFESRKCWG